jgi:hypothetical protein
VSKNRKSKKLRGKLSKSGMGVQDGWWKFEVLEGREWRAAVERSTKSTTCCCSTRDSGAKMRGPERELAEQ